MNKIRRFNEELSYSDELKMGIKIEKEHSDIWYRLDNYLSSFNVPMPFDEEEFYELIAKAHLKELPDYYSRLKIIEKD